MRTEVEVEMAMWIVGVLLLLVTLGRDSLELVRFARELRIGELGTLDRPKLGR